MISFSSKSVKVTIDEWGNSFVVEQGGKSFASNESLPAYYVDKEGQKHVLTEEAPKAVRLQDAGKNGVRYEYPGFDLEVTLDSTEAVLQFDVLTKEQALEGELFWPAPLKLQASDEGYSVLPIMQGMLLFDKEEDCRNIMNGEFVTREGTMPWWGQAEQDCGYMTVVDTLWDARYLYEHKKGMATDIRICWSPSLGALSYDRSMKLYFYTSSCDYVDFCKKYRQLLEQDGLLTLKDKMERLPLLKELIGTPVCYTPAAYYQIEPESTYYDKENPENNSVLHPFSEMEEGLRGLKESGIDKAYVHMDGWSFGGYDSLCPTVLPPNQKAGGEEGLKQLLDTCDKMGYIMAYHDQYRDFYLKSPDYDESKAVVFADGSIGNHEEIIWYGGHEVQLCSTQAMYYLKRNYEEMEQRGLLPKGVYLDVFSASALDECFSEAHPMSKKECASLRKGCFDYLHSKNLIVSSEEIMGEFVNDLDLVHHSPYIMPFFEAYEVKPFGIPVPLLTLVYHDCILVPWFMGRKVWGLPEEEDGFLHCMLCGGIPVVRFDSGEEKLAKAEKAREFQQKVWASRMISHTFLSEDKKVQKAVYENGIEITVDFSKNTYEVTEYANN